MTTIPRIACGEIGMPGRLSVSMSARWGRNWPRPDDEPHAPRDNEEGPGIGKRHQSTAIEEQNEPREDPEVGARMAPTGEHELEAADADDHDRPQLAEVPLRPPPESLPKK